jgi:hypothetical protein
MNKRLIGMLVALVFLLTGCASIVSKSDYPVSLESNPSGATVIITNLKTGKEIYRGKTPCTVTLKAKAGFFSPARYSITFEKPGYKPQTITIKASLDGWYFGNLLLGGVIGMLIVDPATGAMWKLPEDISVNLSQMPDSGISMKVNGKEIKIVLLEDVPKELRDKLVRIK